MSDSDWAGYGRAYAWLGAGAFLFAAVFFVLAAVGVVGHAGPNFPDHPTVATEAQFFAAAFKVDAQDATISYLQLLPFVVGFLTFIPIGLSLRHFFGDNPRASFLSVSFILGGAVGAISQLIEVARLRFSAFLGDDPSRLGSDQQLVVIYGHELDGFVVLGSWLLIAALFMLALGQLRATQLFATGAPFPRALASGSGLLVAVYGLGIILRFTGPPTLYNVLVGLGAGILGPIWSIWLGREFGRLRASSSG
jgi:hypothetical protein